jgi:hypothetical protein
VCFIKNSEIIALSRGSAMNASLQGLASELLFL